jgi:hypothetical protein
MQFAARILLEIAATLITLGGLYDLFVPRLPLNLALICGDNRQAYRLVRELLRALGGALTAIGIAVFVLVALPGPPLPPATLLLVLLLVVPAEGTNALAMRRVGSPFYIPLAFIALTLLGVYLAWPAVKS